VREGRHRRIIVVTRAKNRATLSLSLLGLQLCHTFTMGMEGIRTTGSIVPNSTMRTSKRKIAKNRE
jgi:hypothetical protein